MSLTATVIIATKNRRDELARAVESALTQTAKPEVLVMDDGSTDGATEMFARRFPQARVVRSEKSLGYIVQRNRAAGIAKGDILFSIDDDAACSTPRVVEQTLAEFDRENIGVVAIPYIDMNRGPTVWQRAPDDANIWLSGEFVGTAFAVRREAMLKAGGFREYFFHQGEERDLAIRLLDAGYVVRMGRADPIHHFESPTRDIRRMDLYGRRNDILYCWYNVPLPALPKSLTAAIFSGMRRGFEHHRPLRMVQGLTRGFAAIARQLNQRRPVRQSTYQLERRLLREGPLPLAEVEREIHAPFPR